MKCLSIQQPWSWLIVNGYKDIENRNWSTDVRGCILIHAGKQADTTFFDEDGLLSLPYAEHICGKDIAALMPERLSDYERGGIVGYATLQKVVSQSESPWFVGRYGFVLTQRRPVPFMPLRGQLNFFDVPAEIETEITRIRDERGWSADMADMAQIKQEWREYRLAGDETPPTPPSEMEQWHYDD